MTELYRASTFRRPEEVDIVTAATISRDIFCMAKVGFINHRGIYDWLLCFSRIKIFSAVMVHFCITDTASTFRRPGEVDIVTAAIISRDILCMAKVGFLNHREINDRWRRF